MIDISSFDKGRLALRFEYNVALIAEVKAMETARWNPDGKFWTVADSKRNWFALDIIRGKPHLRKFRETEPTDPVMMFDHFRQVEVPLYQHQVEAIAKIKRTRQHILAYEMGLGKTVIVFAVIEGNGIWVCPKTVMPSIRLMIQQWKPKANIKLITYDELTSSFTKYKDVDFIVFDESSKLKSWGAQRTQAAFLLATAVRERNPDAYILLLTGTPAPKNPLDWWSQCEIAYSGYLRESDPGKLLRRLAVVEQQKGLGNGTFPVIKEWRADELTAFYRRLQGLVSVRRKADCLDLPAKMYQRRYCPPSGETLEYAKLIRNTAERAITALIMLRQLSDGFQYVKMPGPAQTCPDCGGKGSRFILNETRRCDRCDATGEYYPEQLEVQDVGTPKDEALRGLLEECESRIVVYAGYKASVDRCAALCSNSGWNVVRVDGRGWHLNGVPATGDECLQKFTFGDDKWAFVGHPASAGMGLTLTAADTICFFSNDFNGEARMQAEDRIHRIGMKDKALIIDLVHLQTDEYVLENLLRKKNLQNITMGDLDAARALESSNRGLGGQHEGSSY